MSNIHEIEVKGWMPFDLIYANPEPDRIALHWMALFSIYRFGFKLNYRDSKMVENEHGGARTYSGFTITGQEAVSYTGCRSMVKHLMLGGCEIYEARCMDIENQTGWDNLMAPYSSDHPEWLSDGELFSLKNIPTIYEVISKSVNKETNDVTVIVAEVGFTEKVQGGTKINLQVLPKYSDNHRLIIPNGERITII